MSSLEGSRVLLGVTGGIAAYKSPAIVRALREVGADVRVVLTRGAEEFVAPMALQVVSENRVGRSLFDPEFEREIGHIELARWADVLLIAPATANTLARLAGGVADDLLTTIALATTAPIVVAPSMNTQMLNAPATQENLSMLVSRGVRVIEPDEGELACKEVGAGRLPDPPVLIRAVRDTLGTGRLDGVRFVVSAGPTREYFDPVRFLSNPSTGKMGYAIAEAAAREGAAVTLVSGPSCLETPRGCRRINVVTAAEMAAVMKRAEADVVVMTAAVADWRPAERSDEKRKKDGGGWQPVLERTEDILSSLASASARAELVVGFAAETSNVVENARTKLNSKGVDAIVANDVSGGGGFAADSNAVTIVTRTGEHQIAQAPKKVIGRRVVDWIAEQWEAR